MNRMEEIIEENRKIGHHFFDRDTIRFFGTRIESDPDEIGGRWYFITSEQDDSSPRPAWDGERRYTIRVAVKGEIDTFGEFGEFDTLDDAIVALRKIKEA